jgi:NAD(P)-dependent dehydrogenase (short-subunit alcohol dehydrogenase family)
MGLGGKMLLADKICVITGAASRRGIGRATAALFAEHGARTVILDLDGTQATATASELGEAHRGYACDVTDKEACVSAVDQVVREFGRIDVLVNNAGITQPLKLVRS